MQIPPDSGNASNTHSRHLSNPGIGGPTPRGDRSSPQRDSIARCLQRARTVAGLSTRRAARELRVRHSLLRAWEAGTAVPDTNQIERAIRLYGTDLDKIWPDRRPIISPEEPGVLVVGDERVPTTGSNREILTRYIAAVRRQRGMDERETIDLRASDLAMLGAVLDLDDRELTATLEELLGLTSAGATLTVRALAVGVLTAIVASLGAAVWVRTEPISPRVEAAVSSPFSTDATIDRGHQRGTSTFPTAPATPSPRALGSGAPGLMPGPDVPS